MPRAIEYDVITRSRNDGLNDTARNFERVADAADGANASLGESSKTMSHIESESARLKTRIRELTEEFDRTGNVSLFKDIAKDKSALRRIEALGKDMVGSLASSATKAGTEAGGAFVSGFADTASSSSKLLPVLAGVGALAAPMIGAAVAGAVTGAVGVGGIAGGVAAAAQDPRVQAAAKDLMTTIGAEFADSGEQFVGPTRRALATLEDTARDIDLTKLFAPAVPYVDRLADGVSGFVTGFADGFGDALEDAGPAVSVLAEELPQIGDALGDMLADMAASEGAVEGLAMTLDLLGRTIRGTGQSVAWLSDRYEEVLASTIKLGEVASDVVSYLPAGWVGLDEYIDRNIDSMKEWQAAGEGTTAVSGRIGATNRSTAGSWDQLTGSVDAYNKILAEQNRLTSETLSEQMSLDQANLRVAGAWDRVTGAVRSYGTSLDVASDKGRSNRGVILGEIEALARQRDAAIKAGDGSEAAMKKANAAYNRALDKLIDLASKAGFSRKELEKMAKSYEIRITTVRRYVDERYSDGNMQPKAGARKNAIGTLNAPPGWGWVGDAGPELRKLRAGDQIMTYGQSMAAARGSAGEIFGYARLDVYVDGERQREVLLEFKRQRGLTSLGLG